SASRQCRPCCSAIARWSKRFSQSQRDNSSRRNKMIKKLMKRKGLVLLVALVLAVGLGFGGYYGSRYLLKRRIAAWRKDGIAASIAGDHRRASDLLLQYLRRRPFDVEALD